jgi:hypothetical protein
MQNNKEHYDHPTQQSPQQEIDYTPKKYNLTESIQIMLKFFSIPVIIFLLLWFFESR